MKVIVLNRVLKEKHVAQIKEVIERIGAKVCFTESEDAIPEDFKDAEVLFGFGTKTAAQSKTLKWLSVPSAGVDYLMKPGSFANEDCMLTNASGAYGVTIAEHIIAVTLMMMRKLDYIYSNSSNGIWIKPQPQKSLKDCRITVLGTGDIGTAFANRARAFEPVCITGVNRSGKSVETVYDVIKPISELNDVLPQTDLLVMSLPATKETENIMSCERINMLADGAYMVNVGRGSAIDEDALAEALENGRLAGAALDVFKIEPLPEESRLWSTKNLLITPHVAGNQTLAYTLDTIVNLFCDNLVRYAEGKPLKNLIDKNKGY